jgi:DnaJ-class molecular chaperone
MEFGKICHNCHGRGWLGDAAYMESSECPRCHGKGWLGETTAPVQKEPTMTYRATALPPICPDCRAEGKVIAAASSFAQPVDVTMRINCPTCGGKGYVGDERKEFRIRQCFGCYGRQSTVIGTAIFQANMRCQQCCGIGYIVIGKSICTVCRGEGIIGDGKFQPVTACSSCHGSGTMRENTPTETKETVNHPSHYNQGNIEVIDAIEDWKMGFNDGNAIKYIARHRAKGRPQEDLKKALWYIARELVMVHKVSAVSLAVMVETIEKKDVR